MEYANLGRTGLTVSRLVLGTMNFGRDTSVEDSFAMMDKALELGINFFDTADVYGGRKHEGWTEQIIGKWLAQGEGRRERIVLATKCHNDMWEGPNGRGVSAYHIRRACEDSLRRLGTDHIDLYQMHHIDRSTPWEEVYQAMDKLIADGKVLYVGSSNFAGWHLAGACETARRREILGIVSEQSLYNLTDRMIELEVLPACEFYGVGVIPWSPLAGGLLGGVLDQASAGPRRANKHQRGVVEQHRDQLQRWEDLCKDLGEEPANVALAWTLQHPAVTGPIIGPRTLDQLTGSIRSLEIELDEETNNTLDDIWPGPGGPAPEAYAW